MLDIFGPVILMTRDDHNSFQSSVSQRNLPCVPVWQSPGQTVYTADPVEVRVCVYVCVFECV